MATDPGSTGPKLMERLDLADGQPYEAIEAAIHLARYTLALPFCEGRTVLDIACGQGYGAWLMAERWGAARVAAVDSAPEALAAARRYFPSPRIEYREGRAEQLAELFPPEHFDLVVSLETIEHLGDPTAFLRGIRHILRPGGHVVMTCPNDHWYYRTSAERNPFHVRKYLLDEFLALAESELGPARAVLLGFPLAGFINCDADELAAVAPAGMRTLTDAQANVRALALPPNEPLGSERSRYFVAIWGPSDAQPVTAALYPVSLDESPEAHRALQVESLRDEVVHLRTELHALRADAAWQTERATALARAHADLEQALQQAEQRLAAEARAHADVERVLRQTELRLAGVQAEHEYLQEQAFRTRRHAEWLEQQVQTLEQQRTTLEQQRTALAARVADLEQQRRALEEHRAALATRVADLERTWGNRIWGLGRRIFHRLRGRK